MHNCEYKIGIFVQRECGLNAYHSCADCQIRVCSLHHRVIDGGGEKLLCHTCFLARDQIDGQLVKDNYLRNNNDYHLWYSSIRIRHQSIHGGSLFDEQDFRDFDNQIGEESVYAGSDDDFFDS